MCNLFFLVFINESPFVTREKAEKEAAERAKLQQVEESDDGVVVSKVKDTECQKQRINCTYSVFENVMFLVIQCLIPGRVEFTMD